MKNQLLAFSLIALAAEVGTSLLQKYQGAKELGGGLFYPDLGTMIVNRLIIWFVLYFLLSALWLLISRGYQRSRNR
ncbi:MAG TPA: hypothetical protein VJZ26_01065 [Blastocatellia bacterium]|nr:hypothetical protein [Blastocatellia bacterium]